MMTVHKIDGIDGPGYADYLTSKGGAARPGDYYLGRSGRPRENAGTWHGLATDRIGLDGTVRRADLMRVWEGRDPRTGELLVRRGASGDHVAGIDTTFSAPKSVSVLWALSDPQNRAAVESAHHEAVLSALHHIETTVPLARRRDGDTIVNEMVAGIVAARFRHHTSRLTAEQYAAGEAPDPQLHDHVVIANMALRRHPDDYGNVWAAVDSLQLFRTAAESGAVYRVELAARLQRLGYAITRKDRYFEVEGISEEVRQRFSARSAELADAVRAFREEHGRGPTPKERKALTLMTREPKSVDHAPAFEQWARRAGGVELPRPLLGPPAPVDRQSVLATVIAELTDPRSAAFVTRRSAVIDDRALQAAIAEAAQGRLGAAGIPWLIEQVEASPRLQRLDEHHWTTAATRAMEDAVMARADALSRSTIDVPDDAISAAITAARVPLSTEQQAAVRTLTASRFGLLTAPAGAGKGEVLRAVAEVRRATGHRVIALAAAGDTAQRLGRDIGADLSMTIDSFGRRTTAMGRRRLIVGGRDAIVVDEAGLLENERLLTVLRAGRPASVTVAGDPAQLSPIEAGGLFRVMARHLGTTQLSENFRARDAWARRAWSDLRGGQSLRAVARLHRQRRIVISETRRDSRDRAVEQWDNDRREGALKGRGLDQFLLLTDGSNADVDLLNAAAQDRRLQAKELTGPWMEVRAQRDDGGLRVEHLHAGDVVRFTRQIYFGPGQKRVENGASGTLARVHSDAETVDVRLPDRTVTIDGDDRMALRLGYAQHAYNAQGRTVDRVYLITGGWQTARESSYVGVSRAREASFVYSDHSSLDQEVHNRKAALRELIARAGASRTQVAAIGWKDHVYEAREERPRTDETLQRGPTRRTADPQRPAVTAMRAPVSHDERAEAARREADRHRDADEQRRYREIQRD